MSENIVGVLGQELHVGDTIAFVARSGYSYRQAIARVVTIGDNRVVVETGKKRWHYDWKTKKGGWTFGTYKVRIYNWRSAITLQAEAWDTFVRLNNAS